MFWKLLLKCFEMFWFIRCSILKFGLELDANVLVTSSGIETTASWCTVNGMMTTCHHGSSGSLYPPKFFNVFHVVGNMGETVWNLKSAEARSPAEFGPGGKPLSCEICWRIHDHSWKVIGVPFGVSFLLLDVAWIFSILLPHSENFRDMIDMMLGVCAKVDIHLAHFRFTVSSCFQSDESSRLDDIATVVAEAWALWQLEGQLGYCNQVQQTAGFS